ncbi:MAG: hypothetical protein CMK07_05740 [Ponticaulis sp.]|nr:hypothetical protein [Ponticaulis sp.]
MRKRTLQYASGLAIMSCLALPALAQEDFPDPSPDAVVVVINQVQLGDVFANMDVVVDGTTSGASAVATATGNGGSASALDNDLDFDATQRQDGSVTAQTSITGESVYTNPAATVTTAYGNYTTAETTNGTVFSTVNQTSNAAVSASSVTDLNEAGDAVATTTASANVTSYGTAPGTNRGFQTQSATADVTASSQLDANYIANSAMIGSTATGNSISSYGSTTTNFNGALQTIENTATIRSYTVANVDAGNDVNVSATAAANNMTVDNAWGFATLGRDGSEVYQRSNADVEAESNLVLTEFTGLSGATAYGVGNSALISNIGSDTGMYTIQQNNGDVDSAAYFEGTSGSGGAGYASATSIGNAATATLCYTCSSDGVLSGSTAQLNNSNTTATAYARGGYGTYVSGAATAVGNSSTYKSTNTSGQ